jgi:glycine cleavage system H lipoate-binding protein
MDCPFLREANVRSCGASAFRKMILETTASDTERCSSERYLECPAAAPRLGGEPAARCPFLQESHAEFCAAAPVVRYIPASGGSQSRCHSDGHFYCELYLAHADPEGNRLPRRGRRSGGSADAPHVEGIPVPSHLSYAPNHMWLDVAADGYRHVGIDGFLASVAGAVEKVSFATARGSDRAIAVLTVQGVDMQMVFPNPMHDITANVYLRTAPEKLTEDPYGAGWLFEASEPPRGEWRDPIRDGLIDGARAADWIRAENDRLTAFAHERIAQPDGNGFHLAADGGRADRGIASHLDRDELIALYNEFFAPHCTLRRSA